MNEINIASLINLLGYTMGIALYAMLLVMVFFLSFRYGIPWWWLLLLLLVLLL